jgi:D-alanyl-lipoteichoic acid acyltransferase DltB (MBOAT superfamily)
LQSEYFSWESILPKAEEKVSIVNDSFRDSNTGVGGHRITSWFKTSGAKYTYITSGCALLAAVSKGPWAPLMLVCTAVGSYAFAHLLRNTKRSRLHHATGRISVVAAFIALVLLNVTGLVGTLTGAQSTIEAGASSALLAMPFYLLGAGAFVADMADHRRPLPRLIDYGVYLAMPFKLLAGPLEPPRLIEQIAKYRFRWRSSQLLVAWPWLALGAFMKYVVANRLDPGKNLVFTDPITSFATAAIFELKFYFDFAGYSFIAYGFALAVGFRINQNFDHPFLASNVVLFWRSWHMSLGRFLSRYVLEPNLSLLKSRQAKLYLASGIFLVSAMWHGGTLNYLLWGTFHATVYFAYVRWGKRRNVPAAIGIAAMLLFFVFGRMFAIDADATRLILRLTSFFDYNVWSWQLGAPNSGEPYVFSSEVRGLAIAAIFLGCEVINRRLYPRRQGYHLMRRPWFALLLTAAFIFFGLDTGALLYARI